MAKTFNQNLYTMETDFLYHLGINVGNTRNATEIEKQFGDVRVSNILYKLYII